MALLVSPPQRCHSCAAVLACYNHGRTRCRVRCRRRSDLCIVDRHRTSMIASRDASHLIIGCNDPLLSSYRCCSRYCSRHAVVEGWTSTTSVCAPSTIALTTTWTRSRNMLRLPVRDFLGLGCLRRRARCCCDICRSWSGALLLRCACPLEVIWPRRVPGFLVQATSVADNVALG